MFPFWHTIELKIQMYEKGIEFTSRGIKFIPIELNGSWKLKCRERVG